MPDTKPCVFCGKTNDFLMTCEGVCLRCGDRLQCEHGLIIMPVASSRHLRETGRYWETQHEEAEAEIIKLREALEALKRGDCWCEMAIGNPMVKDHSAACKLASAVLEEVPSE